MIAIRIREPLRPYVSGHHIEDPKTLQQDAPALDALVVDLARMQLGELAELVEQYPDVRITVIVDTVTPSLSAFAAAHQVRLLRPEDVMARANEGDGGKRTGPILAFWGVFPRLGTTSLALSVAHVLTEQQHKNVGVLSLNAYNPGSWMLSQSDHHLDNLLAFAQSNTMDRETLSASMERVGRFQYLPGLRNQTLALGFEPEHVRNMVRAATLLFDVVILDVGSVLNTALALEGLRMATHRYVVSNDLKSAERQFFDHYDYVLKPLGLSQDDLLLVGNELHGKGNFTAFGKAVGLLPVTGIPYLLPPTDLYAETAEEPLKLLLSEKQFRRGVEAIALSTGVGMDTRGGKSHG